MRAVFLMYCSCKGTISVALLFGLFSLLLFFVFLVILGLLFFLKKNHFFIKKVLDFMFFVSYIDIHESEIGSCFGL